MKFIHKVTKTGKNSRYVIIPKEILKKLKWKAKQKVVISLRGEKIIIEDYKPKKS